MLLEGLRRRSGRQALHTITEDAATVTKTTRRIRYQKRTTDRRRRVTLGVAVHPTTAERWITQARLERRSVSALIAEVLEEIAGTRTKPTRK